MKISLLKNRYYSIGFVRSHFQLGFRMLLPRKSPTVRTYILDSPLKVS